MPFPSKFSKKNGFSLIELLTVIAIIAVLLAVVFISYRAAKNKLALDRAAFKLAQDIRRVQGMAGTEDAECSSDKKYKYGYGIYFQTKEKEKEYFLFSDCNGNNEKDDNEKNIESLEFEKGVKIKSIKIDNKEKKKVNIVFIPPDPAVIISEDNDNEKVIIELVNDNNQIKTITVNAVGMIDIE